MINFYIHGYGNLIQSEFLTTLSLRSVLTSLSAETASVTVRMAHSAHMNRMVMST
jgi:hypothetical protein